MISSAPDVDTYIAQAPADRQPALERLRALCRRHLPDCAETIEYGMPVYRKGEAMLAFASQKQYISVYGLRRMIDLELGGVYPGAKAGKGCVRFSQPAKIDFAVMERLIARFATEE